MRIGIPKEIKVREGRVALTPEAVKQLSDAGHSVIVERGAGEASGFSDQQYMSIIGVFIGSQQDVWDCDLVIKVKEPIEQEYQFFRSGLTIFSYLHLAANRRLVDELVKTGVRAIALENLEMNGRLPGLDPMSKIAGRLAGQLATHYLYRSNGGSGILLGGTSGTPWGKAVVVGGGVSGLAAAHELDRLGVDVVVFDIDQKKIATINASLNNQIVAMKSTPEAIAKEIVDTDVVIGAVLIPGRPAPIVITEEMVRMMPQGSVIVDIAIDQGGCVEGIHTTTWEDPTYVRHGVIHIAIANMPGTVPRTSSVAVSEVIIPQALKIASGIVDDVVAKAVSIDNYSIVDERIK